MKKVVFIVLILILVLTCGVSVLAGETGNNQLLAEGILERYSGRGFVPELAYLPQAYLILEEALISDPNDHNAQGLMAEYLIQASELFGHHPKKAIKILENLPFTGDEELDALTTCHLGRAYYLDGQREKALSTLIKFLTIYENNEAVTTELAKNLAKEEQAFQASFYPILPFDELVLGIGVTAKYKQISPNISGSYEIERNLFYYSLSGNYTISPLTWVELGYFRENNPLHLGYHYRDGIRTQFTYNNCLGSYFDVALFGGEIGRGDKEKEPVNTKLVAICAEKYLHDDWGKNLSCSFSAAFGTVEKENYQVYRLRLPARYRNYRGLLALGYINQGEAIAMHFENEVRGYRSDDRHGAILLLLSLERSFRLFRYSQKPFLGALQWRVFTDWGTVYNDKADFSLQKSVGAGIFYNTPLFDLCLDLAFTEEGVEPVFELVGKVF